MKIATLAIIVQNNKVLLGHKKKGAFAADTLNGPGGKQEPGESIMDCLIRETEEEVCIVLSPEYCEEIAVVTFFAGGVADFKVHIFRTSVFEGVPTETKDMIPHWFDVDNLPLDQMLESDRTWFAKAIRGEKFNANVFYKNRASGFEDKDIEFFSYSPSNE